MERKKRVKPDVMGVREDNVHERVFKATEIVTPGIKEKVEVKSPIPGGMVKVIALVDYAGMSDVLFAGEVFLLPERRYKSLAFRGFVKEYEGDAPIVNKR